MVVYELVPWSPPLLDEGELWIVAGSTELGPKSSVLRRALKVLLASSVKDKSLVGVSSTRYQRETEGS